MGFISAISNFWNKHGWELILIVGVLLLILGFLFGKGRGSWTPWSHVIWDDPPPRPQQRLFEIPDLITPEKGESKGELECRRALNRIFGRQFFKARPDFMRNPVTGMNLEADAWNPELNLVVEVNGAQHSKFVPYFHKNREAFMNQQYRDHIKKELCMKAGVNFLEVPHTITPQKMESYLRSNLRLLGYKV